MKRPVSAAPIKSDRCDFRAMIGVKVRREEEEDDGSDVQAG
jgi:hypothetical protein